MSVRHIGNFEKFVSSLSPRGYCPLFIQEESRYRIPNERGPVYVWERYKLVKEFRGRASDNKKVSTFILNFPFGRSKGGLADFVEMLRKAGFVEMEADAYRRKKKGSTRFIPIKQKLYLSGISVEGVEDFLADKLVPDKLVPDQEGQVRNYEYAACEDYVDSDAELWKILELERELDRELGLRVPGLFHILDGKLYQANSIYSKEELYYLIKEQEYKKQIKFQKLKKQIDMYERLGVTEKHTREPITEDVRFAVWRRDGGKCVKCGSREKLEFDHIIPVSEGGSNTERNIQILCEKCNREKSDKI